MAIVLPRNTDIGLVMQCCSISGNTENPASASKQRSSFQHHIVPNWNNWIPKTQEICISTYPRGCNRKFVMWVKCRTLPRRAWDVGQSPAERRRISERGLVGLDLYTRVLIYSLFFNYYEFNLVKCCSLSWFYSDCWKKKEERKKEKKRDSGHLQKLIDVLESIKWSTDIIYDKRTLTCIALHVISQELTSIYLQRLWQKQHRCICSRSDLK